MSANRQLVDQRVDILIAEDSPTQAQRLQHILQQQGYGVTHAANGRLALDAARQRKPTLIISDVVMPEMDGYELCRQVKADATLSEIPVILVTTLSDPGDVILGLKCGADNFILKPYDERYLISRVQFVLMNGVMRQTEQGGLAVEIFFNGQRHIITADRLQILNLLLSTYDAAIQRNKELSRVQEELRESGQRLRGIVDNVAAFVGEMTADGVLVDANRSALEMGGLQGQDVIGKRLEETWWFSYSPAVQAQIREDIERALRGEVVRHDLDVRMTGDAIITIDFMLVPVRDAEGRVVKLIPSGVDITERKAAEQALAAAKREAERANRAKSDFLSRMSHDLRTPLNAILGFAQLLETDGLKAEQHDSVRHILKGGAHLLELINEVLDLARIESGHLSLSPEPVAIADIVQHVVALVRPLAAQRGITFDDDAVMACDNRHVLADRQRLNQILMNLLSNAVKYNRDGGRVRVTCEDVPDGRIRIKVIDTGAGIPPEKVKLLFQPFERLSADQTTVEGTGLGLALSKALAEAMGGTLGVESEVDRGSTFWVELARAEAPAETEAPVRARPDASARDAGVTGTVLYIEDNISNRRLMERLLARRPGVRLIAAPEGQAGLDLARAERPDLILLDLHLPDMSGDDVLRRLWADPHTRTIPVAVLSADATPAQTKRLLAAGAIAYLTKPLDIGQVLQLLDEQLAGTSSVDGPHGV